MSFSIMCIGACDPVSNPGVGNIVSGYAGTHLWLASLVPRPRLFVSRVWQQLSDFVGQ